jgi:hypothetical protein
MKFERAGKGLQLEQQLRHLNNFLDGVDLRGGSHRGYVRIFNQGDHSGFDWNRVAASTAKETTVTSA